jgi:hypothetical protein
LVPEKGLTSAIGTVMVFAVGSFSIHCKVPEVPVYWLPEDAVPFTVE